MNDVKWPTSPEEYAVMALSVQYDIELRSRLTPSPQTINIIKSRRENGLGTQIINFVRTLYQSKNTIVSQNLNE